MAIGPGKYDDITTKAREATGAAGVVLIILDGHKGSGFSVQLDQNTAISVPRLLRELADKIERDLQSPH